ncbi:hypothetical protein [Nocardia pseudobrasiliensis]|uniref:Uncharacterized protein n=1 Tax=Nocardia pseudobrasiliensis TaxID=45979 RepID=A0A370ICJ2_9NOCA|nr:hypothetical protein [Nocardia pseudobrasiliensis]RDI68436.1 hypothetical protein DFR76_102837 [Nocardia pseudobrasiliensis]
MIAGMDAREAQQHLQTADTAYLASASPIMPLVVAVPGGVMMGAAVALIGQYSANGVVRLLYWAGAIALAAAAVGLIRWVRRRRGLFGVRGPVREENRALLASALAMLVIGLCSGPGLGGIYLGLGVVVAVFTAVALYKPRYLVALVPRRWR